MTVTLTDRAISKIKEFYSQDESLSGKPLRVFVETGGCSGNSYGFRFDEAKGDDTKETFGDFSLVIDPTALNMIKGSTIDYKEDFGSEGFSITNPNAKKSCGCGNSFEV
jgi:iron-sulfur cluster assembly accessory protein